MNLTSQLPMILLTILVKQRINRKADQQKVFVEPTSDSLTYTNMVKDCTDRHTLVGAGARGRAVSLKISSHKELVVSYQNTQIEVCQQELIINERDTTRRY